MKIRFHSDMDTSPMHVMAFLNPAHDRCDIVLNRPAFATLQPWMKDTLVNMILELAEQTKEPPGAVIYDFTEWVKIPDQQTRPSASDAR